YTGFNTSGEVVQLSKRTSSNLPITATPPATTTCGGHCSDNTTNCAGRFTVRLPAGFPYRLEAQSPFQGGDPAAVSGTLFTASDVNEFCITLGASGKVRGTVFLADGTRAGAGIEVIYTDSDPLHLTAPRPPTTTDGNGQFMFTLLPLRPFVITARDPTTGN